MKTTKVKSNKKQWITAEMKDLDVTKIEGGVTSVGTENRNSHT
jgi:hypothetical protein